MLLCSNTTQPCGKPEPYLENIPYSHGGEETTILSRKNSFYVAFYIQCVFLTSIYYA